MENGRIDHAIEGFTIAGNILDMMQRLEAAGADALVAGERTCASLLFADLGISGSRADDDA